MRKRNEPIRGSEGARSLKPLAHRLGTIRSVKVVGLGGVGCIVARYLVAFLAASGRRARVVLLDGDDFEAGNAERMLFSRLGNKAEVVRDDLLPFVEGSKVTLSAIGEYLTPENIDRLLLDGDAVLLAVDNHATRKLVDDHCQRLPEVCLISGGNDGVGKDSAGVWQRGSYGNVQVYLRQGDIEESPPLSAFHPEIASPRDQSPAEPSCTQAVLATPQILFTNLTTACAMLNTFYLHLCHVLHYDELCFDLVEGLMRPLSLPQPQR